MEHRATSCGCTKDIGMSKVHQPHYCEHGNLFVYTKGPGRASERRQGRGSRRGSILSRGRGFAASKTQQEKVKGLPCIVCGLDGFEAAIDPAHVYPRRLQPCECAEGVVPLCRSCHSLYDDQNEHLDLLPHLINRGCFVELVHAVAVHHVPIRELLDQVTGVKWAPVSEAVSVGA